MQVQYYQPMGPHLLYHYAAAPAALPPPPPPPHPYFAFQSFILTQQQQGAAAAAFFAQQQQQQLAGLALHFQALSVGGGSGGSSGSGSGGSSPYEMERVRSASFEHPDYNWKLLAWLKTHRMHKYFDRLRKYSFEQLLSLNRDTLEAEQFTQGAIKKLLGMLDRVRQDRGAFDSPTRCHSIPAGGAWQPQQLLPPPPPHHSVPGQHPIHLHPSQRAPQAAAVFPPLPGRQQLMHHHNPAVAQSFLCSQH